MGAGTVRAGRFLHLLLLALVSPSVRGLMCLLPGHSSYTCGIDLNHDFWPINTCFKLALLISFCFGIFVFVFSEAISIGRQPLKHVAKYSLYTKFGATFSVSSEDALYACTLSK